jgi:aminopeptidase N
VGKKKIVQGLKKYYAENKFKIADKWKFFKAFKDACHRDLEKFFEGYLNGTTIISNLN